MVTPMSSPREKSMKLERTFESLMVTPYIFAGLDNYNHQISSVVSNAKAEKSLMLVVALLHHCADDYGVSFTSLLAKLKEEDANYPKVPFTQEPLKKKGI